MNGETSQTGAKPELMLRNYIMSLKGLEGNFLLCAVTIL